MAAESLVRRIGRPFASVRVRTTLLATAVVAAALVAAGFALVSLHRNTLTDSIDATIRLRADDIAALITRGAPLDSVTVSDDEVALVQVLDSGGQVVAASPNIAGHPPVADVRPAPGETVRLRVDGLPIDDETFRILARTVQTPSGSYTLYVAGSLEEVSESAASLAGLLRIGIPLVLVAVAGGTWLVVGRALGPVEDIRREVASIGHRQLDRRVPEPGASDEVGRLARTMNAMLARLQAANQRQEEFVADAAHELRSPLAAIRTQLEVDLADPAANMSEPTMRDLLEEVLRMQRLVDDLLLLAESDASRLTRRDQPVDLDDLVLSEVRRARSRPEVAVDATAVSAGAVRGDPGHLTRAIRNLLENAIRHARSRVGLALEERDGVVTFSIVDDGPGIPPEARGRIFERFTRLDTGRARDEGGAGLGLAITKTIVEAHKGSISLSESDGTGARFVVTLPSEGR